MPCSRSRHSIERRSRRRGSFTLPSTPTTARPGLDLQDRQDVGLTWALTWALIWARAVPFQRRLLLEKCPHELGVGIDRIGFERSADGPRQVVAPRTSCARFHLCYAVFLLPILLLLSERYDHVLGLWPDGDPVAGKDRCATCFTPPPRVGDVAPAIAAHAHIGLLGVGIEAFQDAQPEQYSPTSAEAWSVSHLVVGASLEELADPTIRPV